MNQDYPTKYNCHGGIILIDKTMKEKKLKDSLDTDEVVTQEPEEEIISCKSQNHWMRVLCTLLHA